MPAVVLGIDTQIGLTIVRDLGRNGVTVHGLAWDSDAIGLSSRYLRRGLIRLRGESALVQQLVDLRAEIGEACLFAISESDIAMLNRHRARLSGYRLTFADAARMDRVLNKEQTYAAAAKVGVRVPRTWQFRSMPEAELACAGMRFPVVLKWANPNAVLRALSALGLALDKTHYCYSAYDLLAYLRAYEPAGAYPMVQEYCAGYGLGQFVLMKDGHPCYTFQHRRVHEWPPEGGFSTLCESLAPELHQDLMKQSVALLRELEWEGVAMVEYRHDPDTGESALMEINGRFWGSLPLASHAGASFPWLIYQQVALNYTIRQKPYRTGIRCRFMIPETKRLLRILFQQGQISNRMVAFHRVPELLAYLADFVRPGTRYYVLQLGDPGPLLRDVIQAFGRLRRAPPAPLPAADVAKGIDS